MRRLSTLSRTLSSLSRRDVAAHKRTLVAAAPDVSLQSPVEPRYHLRWLPWLSGLVLASLISHCVGKASKSDRWNTSWALSQSCQDTPGWNLLDLQTRYHPATLCPKGHLACKCFHTFAMKYIIESEKCFRRRAHFLYERRIRDRSAPDKVFHYFASYTDETGARSMTPADLLKSLVPVYPPEDSAFDRSGTLSGTARKDMVSAPKRPAIQSPVLDLFDVDGDHLISFYEYLLVVTFLSIPTEECQLIFEMFDTNDSSSISLQEFHAVTTALRRRLRRVRTLSRTGLNTGNTSEVKGLILAFFGPNGDKELALPEWARFIGNLHDEILRLEFEHYDHNNTGYISGLDFARSMIAAVDVRHVDRYLDRASNLPADLAASKVDYEQFAALLRLRHGIHKLAVALDFFQNTMGALSRDDFRRAARKVTGKDIAQHVVDIVFHIFTGSDGSMASHEFVDAMQMRERGHTLYGTNNAARTSGMGLFACLKLCIMKDDS